MNTLLNAKLNPVVAMLRKSGLLAGDLDGDHVLFLRLSKVVGIRGRSSRFLHQEWSAHLVALSCVLFAGFWDKRLGILGAAGSTATFIGTVTIIPFMPDGWDA